MLPCAIRLSHRDEPVVYDVDIFTALDPDTSGTLLTAYHLFVTQLLVKLLSPSTIRARARLTTFGPSPGQVQRSQVGAWPEQRQ